MSIINSIISSKSASSSSLISDLGDGPRFEKAMKQAAKKGREVASEVIERRGLSTRAKRDNEFSFKKGHHTPEEVEKSLDRSKARMPASFRKQVGLGLLAMGREGISLNSMSAGAELMDCSSSGEALKNIFASLGGERGLLKMDKKALPALAQILSNSGLEEESVNEVLGDLLKGGLTVDQLFYSLSKVNLESIKGGGLTATEDGLPALGQFFGSLGASPEIVDLVTSSFKSGESISAADLRNILGASDDGNLAPCLTEADAYNLASLLRSMGANQRHLNTLSNLLAETKGRLSINGFLDFIESMENAPAKVVGSEELAQIKTVLDNITRDQTLAKTPVFDEILTKIQMLGDREIDDKFMKMSPALQALRGGISGQLSNASFGGQNGQSGQGSPNGGHEDKEQYRHLMNAAVNGSETSQAAAIETAEVVQSYGGQESLARQISQKMIYSHRRGLNRLKMKLNPESMGRLDIELKVKDDQLVAHIRAENREAYKALASDINSLKDALAQGGLEISRLTVAFDDGNGDGLEFADLEQFSDELAINAFSVNRAASNAAVYRVV